MPTDAATTLIRALAQRIRGHLHQEFPTWSAHLVLRARRPVVAPRTHAGVLRVLRLALERAQHLGAGTGLDGPGGPELTADVAGLLGETITPTASRPKRRRSPVASWRRSPTARRGCCG